MSVESNKQLFECLRAILTHFQEDGLKVKRAKCQIAVPQVKFLGYLVDTSGLHLKFYNMFLPHKATVAEPLHHLLDKKSLWS